MAFNDFVIGAGTPYVVESVDGLMSFAPLRTQDDNRGYIDGSYSGRDFYDGRTVTVTILTVGDSSHSAQYYFRQLQSAWTPQQLGYPDVLGTFQFKMDAGSSLMVMYGRVRSNETVVDPEYTFGYIQSTFTLYFPDPRYYNNTLNVANVGSSQVAISNNGWATTCPVLYMATPSASFNITYYVNGSSVSVMSFSNVTTSASITIDLLQRTIVQGIANTPSRNTLTSGDWISIPPYSSSNATSLSLSAGTMSVSWRDAFI